MPEKITNVLENIFKGIDDEFSMKLAEIAADTKACGGRIDVMFSRMMDICRNPEEKIYAAYCFGKIAAINDIIHDPKILIDLM